nr:hypothetical protein [Streptococcus sanguinis]
MSTTVMPIQRRKRSLLRTIQRKLKSFMAEDMRGKIDDLSNYWLSDYSCFSLLNVQIKEFDYSLSDSFSLVGFSSGVPRT